jgi:hypothetical protein
VGQASTFDSAAKTPGNVWWISTFKQPPERRNSPKLVEEDEFSEVRHVQARAKIPHLGMCGAPSNVIIRDAWALTGGRKGENMETQVEPTLYDKLGGVYNIATVVDDFIDRIMVDARLNANPRVDEAHHRVSPPGFKYLVTEMVCEATGGPQKYSGRTMGDSHRHLMITDEE